MKISVASGKGGTGKTTVATNLALALEGSVSFLDCDVEEPNGHLFLEPAIREEVTISTFVPLVDEGRCNGCRKCADICRFSAIAVVGAKVLVFPELCHSCEGCMVVCPEGAISTSARELGVLQSGKAGGINFHSGCLRIGEAMSPPLIKEVKSKANQKGVTIIDAPPGTSCPVITAMKDTDFILLVTEPTPFGLHDLRLAVEAVKILGIPAGLVINRADIGDGKVREYAASEQLPVLLEIPFERRIAEAYSRGEPIIRSFPEWRAAFTTLFNKIEDISSGG